MRDLLSRRVLIAFTGLVLALGSVVSCAEPVELVIVNRSERAVAFVPGMIIGPCAAASYDRGQITDAQWAFDARFSRMIGAGYQRTPLLTKQDSPVDG